MIVVIVFSIMCLSLVIFSNYSRTVSVSFCVPVSVLFPYRTRTLPYRFQYSSRTDSVPFTYRFRTLRYGKVSFSVPFLRVVYYLKFRMFHTVYNVPFPYVFFYRVFLTNNLAVLLLRE